MESNAFSKSIKTRIPGNCLSSVNFIILNINPVHSPMHLPGMKPKYVVNNLAEMRLYSICTRR